MIGAIAGRRRGGGGGGGGDPYFANVVLLAGNENGADGTTTFLDQSAGSPSRILTAHGNVQWDSAQAPSGLSTSILFDGTGDYVTAPDHPDLEFGSSDFTMEGFIRPNTTSGNHCVLTKESTLTDFDGFSIVTIGTSLQFYATSNSANWDIANGRVFGTVAAGNWYHFAVCRSGSSFYTFLGGV